MQMSETVGYSKHDQQCCEEISFVVFNDQDSSQKEIEETEKL